MYGWLECRVIVEPQNQNRNDLYLGEVVAAWADDRVFSHGWWRLDRSFAKITARLLEGYIGVTTRLQP